MLPFTKRPGRAEESSDVVAKDEIGSAKAAPSGVVPPASSSRPTTMRPPASSPAPNPSSPRGGFDDDEMTGLAIAPRSLTGPNMASSFPAPMPAAGRPVSIPPPRSARPSIRPITHNSKAAPVSMRPPPSSARNNAYEADEDEDAEDEDGGRTVVRPEGAGKLARRNNAAARNAPSANPTSISPAAVIRKTMESQRANRGLVSGPPPELRGDLDHDQQYEAQPDPHDVDDQFTRAASPRATASSRSGAQRNNYPAPASYEGPPSHRPPPRDGRDGGFDRTMDSLENARGGYSAHESGPISAPISSRSQPPPPASSARPGHFSQPPPGMYSQPPNGVNAHAATSAMPAHMQQHGQNGHVNPHGPTQAMSAVGSGGYNAMGSGPYNAMPSQIPPAAQSSAHGMNNNAMPAHFRMAQTGAITPAMDPPGTSVTSNTRVSGRPAMSWAAALAACGVFVGVVAVAIAQRGDAPADIQAGLVDPSQPQAAKAPAAPVETQQQPVTNPLPPGLIGASPVAPVAQPMAPVAGPVPGMADPNLGLSAPPPAAGGGQQQAQQSAPQQGGATTTPAAAEKPKAPKVTWHAPPAPRPKAEEPTDKPAKAKPAKNDPDEETKKALEELRKAQLEQSLGK